MVSSTGSESIGPKHHRRTAVEHFAGIDVSLEQSSVCVVDATGKIVHEAKVASEPEALVRFFRELGIAGAGSGWRPGLCRNGCTLAWRRQGLTQCCWRRGT